MNFICDQVFEGYLLKHENFVSIKYWYVNFIICAKTVQIYFVEGHFNLWEFTLYMYYVKPSWYESAMIALIWKILFDCEILFNYIIRGKKLRNL
jgi:hypothetical protein